MPPHILCKVVRLKHHWVQFGVVQGIDLAASVTSLVTIIMKAVHKLLLREGKKFTSLDEVVGLHRACS